MKKVNVYLSNNAMRKVASKFAMLISPSSSKRMSHTFNACNYVPPTTLRVQSSRACRHAPDHGHLL